MDIEIRNATEEDALYIAEHLREADRQEVIACGMRERDAVMLSFAGSDVCRVGLIDGERAMIFGCGGELFKDTGSVWALGTDKCFSAPVSMVKLGRKIVRGFLEHYAELENYCDARYVAARRWLRLLGFTEEEPRPYGPRGALFCRIVIQREG